MSFDGLLTETVTRIRYAKSARDSRNNPIQDPEVDPVEVSYRGRFFQPSLGKVEINVGPLCPEIT